MRAERIANSGDQTLLNTSRREVSEERATQWTPHGENLSARSPKGQKLLVNTMYLTGGEKHSMSKDYLDRTHQLIRNLEQERGESGSKTGRE